MAAVASPPQAPVLDAVPDSHQDANGTETLEKPANGNANGASVAPAQSSTKADTPPTQEKLLEVAALPVWAADESEQKFGSLFEKPGRHMIIFIRHFLCGMCQDYLTHLAEHLPPSSLPTDTTLTIVGCGKPELIASYTERIGCPYTIFADPTRALYDALGMTSNLEYGDQKPAYQTRSLATQITRSVWQGITNLGQVSKAGRPSQLGGEMLIETTAEGKSEVQWCHWMQNTRGHAGVDELKKVLGV